MVSQTKNNWTLLFLRFRAFRKAKCLFTLKNENQVGMEKWVVVSGSLSGWRRWFGSHLVDNTAGNRRGSEAHQGGSGGPGVGCLEVDEGVKNESIKFWILVKVDVSDRPQFSGFPRNDNQEVSESWNWKRTLLENDNAFRNQIEAAFTMLSIGIHKVSFSDIWSFCFTMHHVKKTKRSWRNTGPPRLKRNLFLSIYDYFRKCWFCSNYPRLFQTIYPIC